MSVYMCWDFYGEHRLNYLITYLFIARQPSSGRQADSQDHDEGSTADSGEAPFNHQKAHGETRSSSKTTRPKSVKSGGHGNNGSI